MSDDSTTPPPTPTAPAADAITPELMDKIATKLNEVAPNSALCPACQKGRFSVAPHLVTPLIHHNAGMVLGGGATYPQVMLVCGNCGNTRYHNMVVLGLLDGAGNG